MRSFVAGGIVLSFIALVACGDDTDVGDAGAKDGSASNDGAAGDGAVTDGDQGSDTGAPFDAGEHPEAGPQPMVSCGDAGSDAGDGGNPCFDTPKSECLDDTWIIYYYGGTCVSGACQYQTNFYACQRPSEGKCINGACEHPVLR